MLDVCRPFCEEADPACHTVKFDAAAFHKRLQQQNENEADTETRAKKATEAKRAAVAAAAASTAAEAAVEERRRRAEEERSQAEAEVARRRKEAEMEAAARREQADALRQQEEEIARRKEAEQTLQKQEEDALQKQSLDDQEAVTGFLATHGFVGVNVRRKKGFKSKYPLHSAVKRSDADIVTRLLRLRADPTLVNSARQTPRQLAEKLAAGSADMSAVLMALQRC